MKREKDRLRKAKEKKRRNRPHGGGAAGCKDALASAIMRSPKTRQKQRKDAMRKYTIHKAPGAHLTFDPPLSRKIRDKGEIFCPLDAAYRILYNIGVSIGVSKGEPVYART